MKKNKLFYYVIIGLVLVVGAFQSIFVIDMTEQVIITQLGEFVRTNSQPGLDFKIPFIQTVHRFEKRIVTSDAEAAEYLTLDKKRLVVDSYTRWKIVDPLRFFVTMRNESGALSRLQSMVFSELRTHIAAHPFIEIIGDKREPIMEDVAVKAGKIVESFGIQIIDVRIKTADLPQEVQASVFARMNAERQRIAKKYRAEGEEQARIIRAEADKESTIILAEAGKKSKELRGEGDAEAIKIFASAFQKDPEFYAFTKSLETYSKVLDDKTVLVLDSNSDLFRYLDSPALKR